MFMSVGPFHTEIYFLITLYRDSSPGIKPSECELIFRSKEIGFWTLSIVHIFKRLNTQRFGDWICLHPHVKGKKEKKPILLGTLERANLIAHFKQVRRIDIHNMQNYNFYFSWEEYRGCLRTVC
jgi:hypothetical protein